MILKPETNVLVILGGWNANILLNPDWLKRYLFPDAEQFEIKLPLSAGMGEPPSLAAAGVRLSLAGRQLCLAPLTSDEALLDRIQELGAKVADCLPHTPVVAAGVNFVLEADDETVPAWGPPGVVAALSVHGGVTEQVHRYSLPLGKATLNVTVRQPVQGKHVYDCNFDHRVQSLADVKAFLAECRITEYKGVAEKIAAELLSLTEHEGGGANG